jgi:hypothetical protein
VAPPPQKVAICDVSNNKSQHAHARLCGDMKPAQVEACEGDRQKKLGQILAYFAKQLPCSFVEEETIS